MSDAARRRDLVRQYKERKPSVGVFAVRCGATREVWVAASRNLGTAQNPIWFSLRLGSHRVPAMQAAWKAHGAEAFSFEVLEELDTETMTPLGVADLLKLRERHWRAELGAGLATR
jgi:hypothetical protein